MLKSDTSNRDFSGNHHTYALARQLRADLESLAHGCLIWPDARFSHTTTLRLGAKDDYWRRFLSADGRWRSLAERPRPSAKTGVHDTSRRSAPQTSINVDHDIRDM